MKKFLSIILLSSFLMAGGSEAFSQITPFNFTTNGLSTGGYTRDTLGASETGLVKMAFTRKYDAMNILATGLKISGTPSAEVILQGSNDGTEWAQIQVADTLHITNVAGSQNKMFIVSPMAHKYVRVYAIGAAGTQSWSLRATGTVYP